MYIIDCKDISTRILYKILHTAQYHLQEFNIQKAPDDDHHHVILMMPDENLLLLMNALHCTLRFDGGLLFLVIRTQFEVPIGDLLYEELSTCAVKVMQHNKFD